MAHSLWYIDTYTCFVAGHSKKSTCMQVYVIRHGVLISLFTDGSTNWSSNNEPIDIHMHKHTHTHTRSKVVEYAVHV